MGALHILIAEDDPSLQTVLVEIFSKAGFRVTVAADGDQALERFKAEPTDAAILEVGMPGRNGLEVCRELRASPEGRTLPIVLLAARSGDSDRHWGLDAGADDYLTKPFDPPLLIPLFVELIESRRRGEEQNPLTKLPDLTTLARRVAALADGGKPIEVVQLVFEPDSADTYRQKYGDVRFAAAIRTAASCLREAAAASTSLGTMPLIGHAGDVSYSRFALASSPNAVTAAAARARALFRRQVPTLYDRTDRERGHVSAQRADGSMLQVPFLDLRSEPVSIEALSEEPGSSLKAA